MPVAPNNGCCIMVWKSWLEIACWSLKRLACLFFCSRLRAFLSCCCLALNCLSKLASITRSSVSLGRRSLGIGGRVLADTSFTYIATDLRLEICK